MALKVESDSITGGERVPEAHAFGVPDGNGKAAEGGNKARTCAGRAIPRAPSRRGDRLRPRRPGRRLRRQLAASRSAGFPLFAGRRIRGLQRRLQPLRRFHAPQFRFQRRNPGRVSLQLLPPRFQRPPLLHAFAHLPQRCERFFGGGELGAGGGGGFLRRLAGGRRRSAGFRRGIAETLLLGQRSASSVSAVCTRALSRCISRSPYRSRPNSRCSICRRSLPASNRNSANLPWGSTTARVKSSIVKPSRSSMARFTSVSLSASTTSPFRPNFDQPAQMAGCGYAARPLESAFNAVAYRAPGPVQFEGEGNGECIFFLVQYALRPFGCPFHFPAQGERHRIENARFRCPSDRICRIRRLRKAVRNRSPASPDSSADRQASAESASCAAPSSADLRGKSAAVPAAIMASAAPAVAALSAVCAAAAVSSSSGSASSSRNSRIVASSGSAPPCSGHEAAEQSPPPGDAPAPPRPLRSGPGRGDGPDIGAALRAPCAAGRCPPERSCRSHAPPDQSRHADRALHRASGALRQGRPSRTSGRAACPSAAAVPRFDGLPGAASNRTTDFACPASEKL